MVRQRLLSWIPLSLVFIAGCAVSSESAPIDAHEAEPEQVFTRTIVNRADDGTETVATYEVRRTDDGVESTVPLDKGPASADGASHVAPQNCPGCTQGTGLCTSDALRIWDSSGRVCTGMFCYSGAAYTGNELCFEGPSKNYYGTGQYCRYRNLSTGACAAYWTASDIKSFITPTNLYSCFRSDGIIGKGISYPPSDDVSSVSTWVRLSTSVE